MTILLAENGERIKFRKSLKIKLIHMKYLLTLASLIFLFSCGQKDTMKKDQAIDSLQMMTIEKDRQMNSLVSALIEIDDNLQEIKEKEQIITLSAKDIETGGEALEDRINRDIKAIYDLVLKNKEQISQLEKQLQQSGSNNTNLNKLVKRLNNQLKNKTIEIIQLQQKLESQSLEIADLNFTIDGLQGVVDSLERVKYATQQELAETTEKLYRAYYVFGTKKELKEEKIISNDGFLSKKKLLSEGFAQDYFTSVDYRELDSLNVFMPKAKILSNHPASSYSLETADDGSMVVRISDKENFWSLTRHLVIQVNK
jgi:predicted  nucleic acid-binding Zn-ribbon protein